jgi:hypothetical protein
MSNLASLQNLSTKTSPHPTHKEWRAEKTKWKKVFKNVEKTQRTQLRNK